MGLYDGLGGVTTRASTWDVARALEAPVILVVDGGKVQRVCPWLLSVALWTLWRTGGYGA